MLTIISSALVLVVIIFLFLEVTHSNTSKKLVASYEHLVAQKADFANIVLLKFSSYQTEGVGCDALW
ncbi:hypothetical protein I1S38_20125 [Serratia ureilytica]|uniref:hypothetical protein n=1 Tax=Serratia ureilytica TaxID=300181 RepID=UPI0018A727A1|nr:hypothetical protein [Serratia ureilytica]MBF4187966.1 hypothetical protein [Serratia ureilytica]MBF8442078.1 hypothetical protein [Serratia ureilytica]MBF8446223.1 hypothetical protein [Serratia ureilytica]